MKFPDFAQAQKAATTSQWDMARVLSILLNGVAIIILLRLVAALRAVYFSPMSHVPGPKLWIAFPILRWIHTLRGTFDHKMRQFHEAYGEAVRFTANEVSFTTPEAWKQIYGFKKRGEHNLPKPDAIAESDRPSNILVANDADHGRFRRSLAHGLSDRALREQEHIIQSYVDMLISRLREAADSEKPTDLVRWFNFATFDIIGDLGFGSSFNCLVSNDYHFWIRIVMKFALTFQLVEFLNTMPLLAPVTRLLMRDAVTARNSQWLYTTEAVNKRLNDESQKGRADFIDSMTREDLLSYDELLANASMLVLAGSDTTASLLSGAMYWLFRTPRVMDKLVAEVTTTFEKESDITALSVANKLPFLNACLEEALRRYPPVPSLLARVTVDDDTVISGVHVVKGVLVSVHQSASYWTERNFARAREFIPERWLPEAKEPASEFYHDNRAVLQPFATGPRNCVGRNLAYVEMRLVITRLVWNFRFELCPESKRWHDQRSFLLWAKHPLMCRVHARETKAVK